MTKFVVGVKDKDVNLLRRAALQHGMRPEKYIAEVVEAWLANRRSEMKGLSAPQTIGSRSSSQTASDAERSPRTTASNVTITFAETAENST